MPSLGLGKRELYSKKDLFGNDLDYWGRGGVRREREGDITPNMTGKSRKGERGKEERGERPFYLRGRGEYQTLFQWGGEKGRQVLPFQAPLEKGREKRGPDLP